MGSKVETRSILYADSALVKARTLLGRHFYMTRKYPLRGYFLGVLTHTTAWDQLWGGDETLK